MIKLYIKLGVLFSAILKEKFLILFKVTSFQVYWHFVLIMVNLLGLKHFSLLNKCNDISICFKFYLMITYHPKSIDILFYCVGCPNFP